MFKHEGLEETPLATLTKKKKNNSISKDAPKVSIPPFHFSL